MLEEITKEQLELVVKTNNQLLDLLKYLRGEAEPVEERVKDISSLLEKQNFCLSMIKNIFTNVDIIDKLIRGGANNE